jgi:type I restriction enzyme S subunit
VRSLPAGWTRITLGQVLDRIEAGKSFAGEPRPAEADEWGVIKVSAMTYGIFRENENKAVSPGTTFSEGAEIRRGDLLFSRANTRDYVGASVLVGDCRRRLLLSDKSLRLCPTSAVDPRWLWYALSTPQSRRYLSNASTGVKAGMRNISQASLRSMPLVLPPLNDQRRIINILEDHLSRLDAADNGLNRVSGRLSVLKDRVIKSCVLGESEPDNRIPAMLEPVGVDDGHLADLPAGWCWRRLGDLAEVVGGVTKDAKRQSDPQFVEVPYLRVANVQRGWLDLAQVATIRVPPIKAASLQLRAGDVLLNEGGDRDKLARGWIWEGQIDGCIHQNHVFRARVRDDQIEPRLLSWAANTLGAAWAERNGKQSVNLASISLSKIRLMPIPVPPRPLQDGLVQAISDRLAAIDRLNAGLRSGQQRSVVLRRALLDAAFSGRLTGRASDTEIVEEMAGV